jgi:3-hydroxy-9,10-secoandrosta-1,3,5(10)-triene-9,17-dione monooxygenase reductase component
VSDTGTAPSAARTPNPREFRWVLSHVPTAVVVVTALAADGTRLGLAAGTFHSISLDPELVGFYPASSSTTWPRIRDVGAFCVNVLAADQHSLAERFAASGGDKFAGTETSPSSVSGSPVLPDVIAWIDCRLGKEIELGDHSLAVGHVLDLAVARSDHAMVFSRGGYPLLGDC